MGQPPTLQDKVMGLSHHLKLWLKWKKEKHDTHTHTHTEGRHSSGLLEPENGRRSSHNKNEGKTPKSKHEGK